MSCSIRIKYLYKSKLLHEILQNVLFEDKKPSSIDGFFLNAIKKQNLTFSKYDMKFVINILLK